MSEISILSSLNWYEIVTNFFLFAGSFALIVQLFYYLYFYNRIYFYKKKATENSQTPVSIIICARNESVNLTKNLRTILNQNYPNFEVIVVNDSSEDDSATILARFKLEYSNLYVTTIPYDKKFHHTKKLALTVGLKAAKNEWILLTDADCRVEGENWLATMQQNFNKKTNFVLGYGGFTAKKGFLDKLIRFDAFLIAIQYLSFALARIPYMGVGRNLAYRKSVFFENKGFADHYALASGDDDLFVNKNANKKNTVVELDPESFTYTDAKETFQKWVIQKTRHLTTAKFYQKRHKILLILEPFTRFLFYTCTIALIILKFYPEFVIGALIFRLFIQIFVLFGASKKLKTKGLFWWIILFDILLPIVYFYISIKRKPLKNQNAWS